MHAATLRIGFDKGVRIGLVVQLFRLQIINIERQTTRASMELNPSQFRHQRQSANHAPCSDIYLALELVAPH